MKHILVFMFVMLAFSQSALVADAQSDTVDWGGWTFEYTVGTQDDGLAIKNVQYEGKQIMGMGNFPAMPVYYEDNRCGPFLNQLNGDDATVVRREITISGERWYELGLRQSVGNHEIYQVWYFNSEGLIDAHLFSRGAQCDGSHEHWPHWRFDFDIAGSDYDQILRQTPDRFEVSRSEGDEPATAAQDHGWVVQDVLTRDSVTLQFSSGFAGVASVAGTVVPETDYVKNRVVARDAYGDGGWYESGDSSLPSDWNDGVGRVGGDNGWFVDETDIVLWYSGYLPYSASDNVSLWRSTGVQIIVNDPAPPPVPTFTYSGSSTEDVIPHSSELDVAADNQNFSYEFCIRPEEGPTGEWRVVMHKGNSNQERTFGVWLRPGKMQLHYTYSTTDTWNYNINTPEIPLNQPTKVTIVRQGDRSKLYLDGVRRSDFPIRGDVISNTGPLYILDSPAAQYDGMKGKLTQVTLYDEAIRPTIGGCTTSTPEMPSLSAVSGRLVQVDSLNYDQAVGVNRHDEIWYYNSGDWTRIKGALSHASVGIDGTIWGVNSGENVYRRASPPSGVWERISGIKLVQIDALDYYRAVGVDSDDNIYYYDGSSWTQLSGKLKQVSIGIDGSIWGSNTADSVYRRASGISGGWERMPGTLTQVDALNYDNAVGSNSNGQAYYYDGGWNDFATGQSGVSYGQDGAVWAVGSDRRISRSR